MIRFRSGLSPRFATLTFLGQAASRIAEIIPHFRPALARRSIETADHGGHVLTGRTETELNA